MKNFVYKLLLIFADMLFLIAVFFIALKIRENISPPFHPIHIKEFAFVFIIVILSLCFEGVYKYRYDFWQESFKILKGLFFSYLIVLSILTLMKTNMHYSRFFITLYFFLTAFLFLFYKRLVKYLLFKMTGAFKQKVLVIGSKKQKNLLCKELRENWYLGMDYNDKNYEYVFITSQNIGIDEIKRLIDKFAFNKKLFLIPYVTDINFANSTIMEYTNIRLNSIVVENKLLNKTNVFIKNMTDYFIAFSLLPLFLIIHFIIYFLIKSDSKGSVFFKQKRIGKNGRAFYVYKYRTMYEDSGKILEEYLKENPSEIEYYDKYHKYKNDPRITKIGKFLRTTSLDELPQILNVLKGEMSIVGPRPYMPEELNKLGKYKDFILKVKPGITGLWQVSGRNNLTFAERNRLEVWYIKNWSLWLDFVILVKTVKVVLLKIGAK